MDEIKHAFNFDEILDIILSFHDYFYLNKIQITKLQGKKSMSTKKENAFIYL